MKKLLLVTVPVLGFGLVFVLFFFVMTQGNLEETMAGIRMTLWGFWQPILVATVAVLMGRLISWTPKLGAQWYHQIWLTLALGSLALLVFDLVSESFTANAMAYATNVGLNVLAQVITEQLLRRKL